MTGEKRRPAPPIRKSLGQHFLSDPSILSRIADALGPLDGGTVVEIGAGRGALTDQLLERAGRVIAVEVDRALASLLRERYAGDARVTIVEGDILRMSLGELAGGEFALIGNVPYYITTPIVFHALERPRPTRAVFLVQREVADRMTALPNSSEYGALTVNLHALAHVEMLFTVPAGAFNPPPKVQSAVVRLEPLSAPLVPEGAERSFRTIVQAAFGLRRKQMRRVVRSMTGLDPVIADRLLHDAGIEPESRPEVLSPEQFAALSRVLPPATAP
ncbi:MAG TPA: 16S rRNA (adenine(1518)-N(6)/adenine(1519)-N(6))-dimethyltransferase RsmA [Gemmatimonadaceae bacterium]